MLFNYFSYISRNINVVSYKIMKLSQNGVNLIKNLEGYREKPYKCSAGKLTIGYGHTNKVYEGQRITKEQADNFLKEDVKKI